MSRWKTARSRSHFSIRRVRVEIEGRDATGRPRRDVINTINENIILTIFPSATLFSRCEKKNPIELEKEKERWKRKEEDGGDRNVATVLYIASISFARVDVFTKNGIPRRAK